MWEEFYTKSQMAVDGIHQILFTLNSFCLRPPAMPGVNVDLNFVSVRSVPPYEGEPRRIDTSTPVVVVGMVGWEVARW